MQVDWSIMFDFIPRLIVGAKVTIYITVLGLIGGIILGVIAGLMHAYGSRTLNAIAFTYIELIRGTPIVVQVMFLYFALPVLADIRIDPMSATVLAIVLNAGAYIAEIVRGAFLSIHKGFTEAEMSFAKQVGTRLIFMEHGKIAVDDNPRTVIDSPPNPRMKDFLSHVG